MTKEKELTEEEQLALVNGLLENKGVKDDIKKTAADLAKSCKHNKVGKVGNKRFCEDCFAELD